MKPVAFDYTRPSDIDSALQILAGSNGNARLVAGGQSLGPMLNLRLARPSLLVDIARIPELRTIEEDHRSWRIGAAVTHAEIEDGQTPLGGEGFLPEIARQIAYRAIRNRGTIGGSLAHADPAADWPLALAALDAEVEVRGPRGQRRIKADRFMSGPFVTALVETDIIIAIHVPRPGPAIRSGYFKLCRKAGEFPIASAAVVVDDGKGRVFLGALPDKPRSLPSLALQLAETGIDRITTATLAEAVSSAVPDIDSIDLRMFVGCLTRAIEQAFRI